MKNEVTSLLEDRRYHKDTLEKVIIDHHSNYYINLISVPPVVETRGIRAFIALPLADAIYAVRSSDMPWHVT